MTALRVALALSTGIAVGWLICGLAWWVAYACAGYRPSLCDLRDFYCVWRWRRRDRDLSA